MTNRLKFGVGGAVAAVVAAVGIVYAVSPSHAEAGPSGSLTAAQMTIAKAAALRAATANGDPTPDSVTAVVSTRRTVLNALGGGDFKGPDVPALIIEVRGTFTTTLWDHPPGASLPSTISELLMVLDPETGRTFDFTGGQKSVDLAQFGHVTTVSLP